MRGCGFRKDSRPNWRLLLAWAIACGSTSLLQAQSTSGKTRNVDSPAPASAEATPAANSMLVMLLRDEAVRGDLRLTQQQAIALDEALTEVDYPLWLLRDVKESDRAQKARDVIAKLDQRLATILRPPQRQRLDELHLRAQGWPGVLSRSVAEKLRVTADQRSRIEKLLESTKQVSGGKDSASIEEQIKDTLTLPQQRELGQLVGKPFDVTKVRARPSHAPPIQMVDEWVNTEPVTWDKLKGKVVAVHFWTYGCINCVHNLPWYKAWHEELADKGLVILGFHTPETQGERVPENVRRKIQENEIKYPVAIDNDGKNWIAYANHMWPSVYLVDKRGYLRYWWYGEMNWQETKGEEFMRRKIKELLAETD